MWCSDFGAVKFRWIPVHNNILCTQVAYDWLVKIEFSFTVEVCTRAINIILYLDFPQSDCTYIAKVHYSFSQTTEYIILLLLFSWNSKYLFITKLNTIHELLHGISNDFGDYIIYFHLERTWQKVYEIFRWNCYCLHIQSSLIQAISKHQQSFLRLHQIRYIVM